MDITKKINNNIEPRFLDEKGREKNLSFHHLSVILNIFIET